MLFSSPLFSFCSSLDLLSLLSSSVLCPFIFLLSLLFFFYFLCSSLSIIFVFVRVFCAPLQFYLASGLIVPGDLPDDKMRGNSQVVSLFQATCPMVKIQIFFCGLILVGGLPRLKFLKGEKFPKVISNLDLSRWPSI